MGVIISDDRTINVEKKKRSSLRRGVNEESRIMSTGRESSNSKDSGETLKPGMSSLFETIESTTKTTNIPIRSRIPRGWPHIDFLMQITIKKGIIDI